MRRTDPIAAVLLAPLLLGGCGSEPGQAGPDASETPPPIAQPAEIASPAAPGSEEPNLSAAPDGRVYMTWFEPEGERWLFRISSLGPADSPDAAWSPPVTISDREHSVNWADFPSVLATGDGRVAVHFSVRSRDPLEAGVHVAWSDDDGATWSEPVVPHRPGTEVPGAPGFVSLIPWSDGDIGVMWLTEFRETALRFATVGPEGARGETIVDALACDCCQTSAAVTSRGPVVVYRDRTPEEVRDISILRWVDGAWTEPARVHEDGWEIGSCPVNGPMVDAEGEAVAVAWFTAPGDVPQVNVAFSADAGASFGDAVRVDDGTPSGRVAVQLLGPDEAVVSWLERTEGGAEVRARRVGADGRVGAATTVALSNEARTSGFPRMALSDDRLLFAWTDVGGAEPQVRTAIVEVPGGR